MKTQKARLASKSAATVNTVKKQRDGADAKLANLSPFQPGLSGNPKGRPKGSRNKLGEDFLTDLLEVWGARGKECIEATATNHPEKLVSIVAGILPKELNVKTNPLEQMSDVDLERAIAEVKLYLRLNGIDPGPDDDAPSVKH